MPERLSERQNQCLLELFVPNKCLGDDTRIASVMKTGVYAQDASH
jgi:hypothetical protein